MDEVPYLFSFCVQVQKDPSQRLTLEQHVGEVSIFFFFLCLGSQRP
jgi:hypothetical protein